MPTKYIFVNTGDSISGGAAGWFYKALGVASVGDSGEPQIQAAATYLSGSIVARNMAIAGTRFGTGVAPDLSGLFAPYIDPIVATKTGSNNRRVYIYNCAIGSNDACIGGSASVAAYATTC